MAHIVSKEEVHEININVGRELCTFTSYTKWLNKASSWLSGWSSYEIVAIDAEGRICSNGGHIMRADNDGTFPIKVYLI